MQKIAESQVKQVEQNETSTIFLYSGWVLDEKYFSSFKGFDFVNAPPWK